MKKILCENFILDSI